MSIRSLSTLIVAACTLQLITAMELRAENRPARGRVTKPVSAAAVQRPDHLLVVLIGGMNSDPTPRQIQGTAERAEGNSGLYRLRGDLLRSPQVVAEYFNWNGSRAGELHSPGKAKLRQISQVIEDHADRWPGDRISVIGNSWGGHSSWEVLRDLEKRRPEISIDLVVFLDGSSTGRGPLDRKTLPANIARAVNIHTRNNFVWGKLPTANRLSNLDLGDPANGFLLKKGPSFASTFSFDAHVLAEWDERLHALMRRQLLDLLPASHEPTPTSPSRPANAGNTPTANRFGSATKSAPR